MKPNNLAIAIGNRISKIRHELGISQEELEQNSGVSKNIIGQIERGELPNPSLTKISEISRALNIALSDLFYGIELISIEGNTEEDEIKAQSIVDGIVEEALYPPKFPLFEVSTLLEFLLYLPLMNPQNLFNSLFRISGSISGHEQYVLKQINYCISSIPTSAAKDFANIQAKRLNRESYRCRYDELETFPSHQYEEYVRTIKRAMRFFDLQDAM